MDKDLKSKVQTPLWLHNNCLLADKRAVVTKSTFDKLFSYSSHGLLTKVIKYKGKLLKNVGKISVLGVSGRCYRRCVLR